MNVCRNALITLSANKLFLQDCLSKYFYVIRMTCLRLELIFFFKVLNSAARTSTLARGSSVLLRRILALDGDPQPLARADELVAQHALDRPRRLEAEPQERTLLAHLGSPMSHHNLTHKFGLEMVSTHLGDELLAIRGLLLLPEQLRVEVLAARGPECGLGGHSRWSVLCTVGAEVERTALPSSGSSPAQTAPGSSSRSGCGSSSSAAGSAPRSTARDATWAWSVARGRCGGGEEDEREGLV